MLEALKKAGIDESTAQLVVDKFPELIRDKYVPVSRINELRDEIKGLNSQISERDTQLKKLKDSAGDNEELKKKIESLQSENKTAKENYEKQISDIKFNSTEYKRARVMYVGYCTFEYFISILAADVFLAKLLTHMGVSDGVIGIISSFITLAFLFQLLAIFIAQRIRNTKSTVLIFEGISQIFFAMLYLIPFINASPQMRAVIVSACIFGAYITKYLVSNILFKWANSYVEPYNRGVYSAVKEMISLISGIVFTLIIGHVVDSYEAAGKIESGFIFLSVTIFALAVVNTVCLLLIKGEKKRLRHLEETRFRTYFLMYCLIKSSHTL